MTQGLWSVWEGEEGDGTGETHCAWGIPVCRVVFTVCSIITEQEAKPGFNPQGPTSSHLSPPRGPMSLQEGRDMLHHRSLSGAFHIQTHGLFVTRHTCDGGPPASQDREGQKWRTGTNHTQVVFTPERASPGRKLSSEAVCSQQSLRSFLGLS